MSVSQSVSYYLRTCCVLKKKVKSEIWASKSFTSFSHSCLICIYVCTYVCTCIIIIIIIFIIIIITMAIHSRSGWFADRLLRLRLPAQRIYEYLPKSPFDVVALAITYDRGGMTTSWPNQVCPLPIIIPCASPGSAAYPSITEYIVFPLLFPLTLDF